MKTAEEKWHILDPLGPCVCSQIRRTARKVSALYDGILAAAGLTITQHSLLVNIAREEEIGRSALAHQLGMDRTTLTRNLKPLENAKLVVPGQSLDRRERCLRLSPAGYRKLRSSYACWENAQKDLMQHLRPGALAQFRKTLEAAERAAEATAR